VGAERLGGSSGQRYVETDFGPEGKQRMLKMVDAPGEVVGRRHPQSVLDDGMKQAAAKIKLWWRSEISIGAFPDVVSRPTANRKAVLYFGSPPT